MAYLKSMENQTFVDPQAQLGASPQRSRNPFTRWPRVSDGILAFLLFLWSVFVTFDTPDQTPKLRSLNDIPLSVFFVFAMVNGALYWRRNRPLVVLGVNQIALVMLTVLNFSNDLWSFPFALYSVGRYTQNDQWSYYGIGTTLALIGIISFSEGETLPNLGAELTLVFFIWYIGRSIQIRAEQLEREKTAEAHRAVAEERTRIARELHDVVAHQVSMMTVQAGAAKTVATNNPEGAVQAMEAVEQTGRHALNELRHLLGVLRPEAGVNGLIPQPGIAEIPSLVDKLREVGLAISVSMNDMPIEVPARVDLSAYRIVQEALTNVLKHAGPDAQAEVRLKADNNSIDIEVLDNGVGTTILPGTGHGIAGMRERAELLGGYLKAEPRQVGGFYIEAHLPIEEELT